MLANIVLVAPTLARRIVADGRGDVACPVRDIGRFVQQPIQQVAIEMPWLRGPLRVRRISNDLLGDRVCAAQVQRGQHRAAAHAAEVPDLHSRAIQLPARTHDVPAIDTVGGYEHAHQIHQPLARVLEILTACLAGERIPRASLHPSALCADNNMCFYKEKRFGGTRQ